MERHEELLFPPLAHSCTHIPGKYREFLPQGECHSIEISCIEEGPREEGKWPWGNFAAKNKRYQQYLDENRLHCGDAMRVPFLESVWRNQMKRPGAPPLRIVVDDGSHIAAHMVSSSVILFIVQNTPNVSTLSWILGAICLLLDAPH